MSEKSLREIYFPPFQAGVEAGARSLMTAFNTLNGIPATANARQYASLVKEKSLMRELIGAASEILDEGFRQAGIDYTQMMEDMIENEEI